MQTKLKYTRDYIDVRGERRIEVRYKGKTLPLESRPNTVEFVKEWERKLNELRGTTALVPVETPAPQSTAVAPPRKMLKLEPSKSTWPVDTLGWLADEYYESDEFQVLSPQDQRGRKSVISGCLEEMFEGENGVLNRMGDCPLHFVDPAKVRMLRKRKEAEGFPSAANNRKKWISAMFTWAIENEKFTGTNPARDVARVKITSDGWHTWTEAEIAQYREYHPIGGMARLALDMLLFVGQRGGDFVKLGPRNLTWERYEGKRRRAFSFSPSKTKKKKGESRNALIVPIIDTLWQTIEATSPIGTQSYLITSFGAPFRSANGFRNWFRERCNEAGLYHCTAHGLRKAGATIAANEGATVAMLMAMYGWTTPQQAMEYVRKADQRRLSFKNAELIERGHLMAEGE